MPPRARAAPAASERSGMFRRMPKHGRGGAGIEAGVLPNGKTEAESARAARRGSAEPGGASRAARQRREVETLHPWTRSALLVTKYGGFNEVQETPPF